MGQKTGSQSGVIPCSAECTDCTVQQGATAAYQHWFQCRQGATVFCPHRCTVGSLVSLLRGAKYPMNILPDPAFLTYALQNAAGTKSSEPDIRRLTVDAGARFLQFNQPANTTPEARDKWRTMENKGLFVTLDGCIFPHKYYWSSNKQGDKYSGHLRSADYFLQRQRLPGVPNQYGWPTEEQVSHLCHRENCINPMHLTIEAQWKNLRRNYCGLQGDCTCGSQPACLKPYMNWSTFLSRIQNGTYRIVGDPVELSQALADLGQRYPFKVLPQTHYAVEDTKRINRNQRKDKKRKHDQQHLQNEARRKHPTAASTEVEVGTAGGGGKEDVNVSVSPDLSGEQIAQVEERVQKQKQKQKKQKHKHQSPSAQQ